MAKYPKHIWVLVDEHGALPGNVEPFTKRSDAVVSKGSGETVVKYTLSSATPKKGERE